MGAMVYPLSIHRGRLCVRLDLRKSDHLLAVHFHGGYADDVWFQKEEESSGSSFHSDCHAMCGSHR